MTICNLNDDLIKVQTPEGRLDISLTENGKACRRAIRRQIMKDLLFYDIKEKNLSDVELGDPSFEPLLGGVDGDDRLWTAAGKDYVKEAFFNGSFTLEEI